MRAPARALAASGLGALAAFGAIGAAYRSPPALLPPPDCETMPVLDPAQLVGAGRFWHASRLVPSLRGTRPVPAESVILRAEIAEGLGRFDDVDALVRRARGGDSVTAFQLIAARADERAERWPSAAARYRRVLALDDTSASGRAAAPRLAFVLERTGTRDSAAAAWRRAARTWPELADWFAIRRAAIESDTAIAFAAVSASRTPGAEQQAQLLVADRRLSAGNLPGALALYQIYGGPLDIARVEFALGHAASARARADSMLFAFQYSVVSPNGPLAANFLTERFPNLTSAENLAVSRSYRVRRDLPTAERYARAAIAAGRGRSPDDVTSAWLELAVVESQRRALGPALRAVDSAGAHGQRSVGRVEAARVRVLAGAGRWDQADSVLQQAVRRLPGDTDIARMVLLFADRHRGRSERMQERARYLTLLLRFPDAPAALAAKFRMGLFLYQEGRPDSALALIADAARRDSVFDLGLGPRYWEGRLRYERGDSSAAALLRIIARAWPTWFYGVRARELLGDTAFLDPAPPLPAPGSFPPARARERIRLLTSLGFDQEARAEALGWLRDTTVSARVLVAAAEAAGAAGYARESIQLGERARALAGMAPEVARALFPYSFREVLEGEAAEHCVDPLLLAALIRQESRFDPRAVSRAGARGLSQVMPATGAEMTRRMRAGPWDPDLLFVPDFNLHLGARYVSDRMARDTFPVYALLASYNAGAARVSRWRLWPEFDDPDLFVERVSIAETQNYVRTVYASYVWYRYAWASESEPSPAGPAPLP